IYLVFFTTFGDMRSTVCPLDNLVYAAEDDTLSQQKEFNSRALLSDMKEEMSDVKPGKSGSLDELDVHQLDVMMDTDDARIFRYEFYAAYPEVTLADSPRMTLVGYSKDSDVCTGFRMTLLSEKSGKRRYEEISDATFDIIDQSEGFSDSAKVKIVRRWIKSRCRYTDNVTNMWDESLYGCLVKGSATCLGYSEGFYYMMRKLHVPCRIVAEGYHAWNEVYVDGKWNSVDLTK
ncbi:MAG: transglutaminase domain-containing protein, partial [Mogibacterium sp.]|nr:transglutaminase domain-containing protein [Mogibacterium sp.]